VTLEEKLVDLGALGAEVGRLKEDEDVLDDEEEDDREKDPPELPRASTL